MEERELIGCGFPALRDIASLRFRWGINNPLRRILVEEVFILLSLSLGYVQSRKQARDRSVSGNCGRIGVGELEYTIGSNTANNSRVFQFTDTNAPAFPIRFYRALFRD